MRRSAIVVALLFCISRICVGQQQTLQTSVDREFVILKSLTDADDKLLDQIKLSIQPAVEKLSAQSENRLSFVMGYVPPAIYDGIAAAARNELVNSKFTRYDQDLRARRTYQQRMAAGSFMIQVNRAVGVRSDQWDRVKSVVDKLAKADALPPVLGVDAIKPSSRMNEALRTVLSDDQFELWGKNATRTRATSFTNSDFEGDVEDRRRKLKSDLFEIAAAKTAWARDEFKLSAGQTRKLELAAKGAISKLIDRRMAAEASFAEMLQNPANMKFNSPDAQLAMADRATLFSQHSRWRRLALSVLSAEQKKAFMQLEAKRRVFAVSVATGSAVLGFGRVLTLNSDQTHRFHTLVEAKLLVSSHPDNPFDLTTAYKKLGETDAAEFIAAVGESNWELLKPQIQQMKRMMATEDEKSKD